MFVPLINAARAGGAIGETPTMRSYLITLALLGTTSLATPTFAAEAAKAPPGRNEARCTTPDGATAWALSTTGGRARADCKSAPRPKPDPKAATPPPASATPAAEPKAKPAAAKPAAKRPVAHRSDGIARWQYYNRDRAYATKEEALAHAERDFIRAGWPAAAAASMATTMRSENCERIELSKDDRLDFMRTGPSGLWRNVLVDFVQPANMRITAPACKWTKEIDGVMYEAILPDVCFNLAGRKAGIPCDYVLFPIRRQGESIAHIPGYGPLTDSVCHGYVRVEDTGTSIREISTSKAMAAGCIRYRWECSFEGADAVARPRTRTAEASIPDLTPGQWAIRVSRKNSANPASGLGICIEYIDPVTGEWKTSYVAIATSDDYVKLSSGQQVARVAYKASELPPGTRVQGPGYLYLWDE